MNISEWHSYYFKKKQICSVDLLSFAGADWMWSPTCGDHIQSMRVKLTINELFDSVKSAAWQKIALYLSKCLLQVKEENKEPRSVFWRIFSSFTAVDCSLSVLVLWNITTTYHHRKLASIHQQHTVTITKNKSHCHTKFTQDVWIFYRLSNLALVRPSPQPASGLQCRQQ